MKRTRTLPIGQLVGVGFGLVLFLALLIGLGGRVAYDISKRQNEIIQTRGILTGSGSSGPLLARRPLRTGFESFQSSGSGR